MTLEFVDNGKNQECDMCWYRAGDFDGWQIPVTTGAFEHRAPYMHQVIALHVRGSQFKPSCSHCSL